MFPRFRLSAPPLLALVSFAVWAALTSTPAHADEGATYQMPPQALVDIVDAPMTPYVEASPDGKQLLLLEWNPLTTLDELAEEELRLGGLRFSPVTFGPTRTSPVRGLSLVDLETGATRTVAGLPATPRLSEIEWSPDGRHVSFVHTVAEGNELWIADLENTAARRLLGARVHLVAGIAPQWLDDETLVAPLIPAEQPAPPTVSSVPTGPTVQESSGDAAPARTYQDLLASPHDERLLEHYLRVQLARVDLAGVVTPVGEPALFGDMAPSPDGRYLEVEILHPPWSYQVPVFRFPWSTEVWTRDGDLVRQIDDRPLQDRVPLAFGSVPTGARQVQWRADAPATLVWAEALDGGDAGRDTAERDRLYLLEAPFDAEPTPWITLDVRVSDITWGRDDLAIVTGRWWKTRQQKVWRARPAEPSKAGDLLFDYSWQDRYADPGRFATTHGETGREVLRTSKDGRSLYLLGDGASAEGDRPFVDRYDLASGETERLWRSAAPFYEEPRLLLDDRGRRLLTRRESREQPPNYYLRDLGLGGSDADAALRQLTHFEHPTPQLEGLGKELVRYTRDDGVQLTGTLYTPPGWKAEHGPLPTLLWAYPREFKSADAAGQVDDSPYRFDRASWWSPVLWTAAGYAVFDDPKMPIIGEGDEEPNDTFREQLVASAAAAVDELVRRGVSEPGRLAIGGHSYGAFMTANLLAHSDLFAAGIARSGAYNRTLTPFGFQSEERTLWEATDIYVSMSPFLHAEKVNEPILLIHGAADNNAGTYPLQSERFFHALRGHGATARLVMLPLESHGYRARRSVLHQLWETWNWLETHVAPPVDGEPATPSVEGVEVPAGG